MEGMGLVLRVGEDRVPQLPRHFPTCNVFDWTSEEFEWYQTNTVMTSLPPTLPTHPPVDGTYGEQLQLLLLSCSETVWSTVAW